MKVHDQKNVEFEGQIDYLRISEVKSMQNTSSGHIFKGKGIIPNSEKIKDQESGFVTKKKDHPMAVPFWWIPTSSDADVGNLELKYEEIGKFELPFYTNSKPVKKGDALYVHVEAAQKPVAFSSCKVTNMAKRPRTG